MDGIDTAYTAATEALTRFATGPCGDLACIGPSRAAALAVDAALRVLQDESSARAELWEASQVTPR